MSLFSRKPDTSIGIDFGVDGIKLVELEEARGRAHLSTYAVMQGGWGKELEAALHLFLGAMGSREQGRPSEAALKQIGGVVKQVVQKSRAKGREVIASIPAPLVFNAVIGMPELSEKEWSAYAKEEATKLLPLPAPEMVLDFQKIEEEIKDDHGKRTRVLVTAASRALVDEFTSIFRAAGLALTHLETESFALIRALLGRDPAPAFILDMGSGRTNLFVVKGGVPLIHRSINFGGHNFNAILKQMWDFEDEALLEQAKHDLSEGMPGASLPAPFIKILEPVVKELKYHIELFTKEEARDGVKPEKIVLTGGASLFAGLARFLEESTNITTYIGDPWARVVYPQALKPALDALGPRFAVAVGLAARRFAS